MVRMSSERETIISIRHQVNQHIQAELAQDCTSADQPPIVPDIGDTQTPHVLLGSWDKYCDITGYEEEVLEEFGFADFAEKLVTFLQQFKFDVHGKDFNLDTGHKIHIK